MAGHSPSCCESENPIHCLPDCSRSYNDENDDLEEGVTGSDNKHPRSTDDGGSQQISSLKPSQRIVARPQFARTPRFKYLSNPSAAFDIEKRSQTRFPFAITLPLATSKRYQRQQGLAYESLPSQPSRKRKPSSAGLTPNLHGSLRSRNSFTYDRPRYRSRGESSENLALTTEDTFIFKRRASKRFHLACSRETSETSATILEYAAYLSKDRSEVPSQEESLKSRLGNHLTED